METDLSKNSHLTALDKWSSIFVIIAVLATPLLFWPMFGLSLEVVKKFFLVAVVAVALILWFLGRIRSKVLILPKTWIWGTAGIFCLLTLISALFSDSIMSSLLGFGFESGTVFSIVFLFGLAFLVSEYFGSKPKFFKIHIGLLAVFAIAFLLQALRFIFGNFLPWSVFDPAAANLIGKWNDLGALAGLIAIMSTVMIERFPLKEAKALRISIWLSLVMSVVTLFFVNLTLLWIILAVMFLILYVFNVTILAKNSGGFKRYLHPSLVMLVIAILFVVLGRPLSYDAAGKPHEGYLASLSRATSYKLNISALEVRPSWQGTLLVTKASLKEDPIVGTGPNRFSQAWLQYKPEGINGSQFWNIEPDFGIGFVPTFFVTTGLLGGLAFLAFVILLISAGARALFDSRLESMDRSFLLLSFVGTVYVWALLVFYVPQTSLLAIAFVLTGLYIARLAGEGEVKTIQLKLATDGKTKFVSALGAIAASAVLVVLILGLVASLSSVALIQKAGAAIQAGEIDRAYSQVKKAIWMNPEDVYYRTALQLDLSRLSALLNNAELSKEEMTDRYGKMFAEAKANADAAVDASRSNYQNYIARGGLYENIMTLGVVGAYDLAKENYLSAQALNPKGPDMELLLARLEMGNKNYTEAEKHLEAALVLKKDFVDAIYLQSELYASRGFLDTAVSRAQYAAQLAPNDAGVLFQLGYLQYRNADYRNAVKSLEAAVTLVPDYANALYFLGLSQDKLGQTAKALATFTLINKNNPGNTEVEKIIVNLNAGREALAGAPAEQKEEASPAKKQ